MGFLHADVSGKQTHRHKHSSTVAKGRNDTRARQQQIGPAKHSPRRVDAGLCEYCPVANAKSSTGMQEVKTAQWREWGVEGGGIDRMDEWTGCLSSEGRGRDKMDEHTGRVGSEKCR